MASIIKKVYRRITDWKWNIALCDTPVDELIAGKPLRARWLKHNYTDRWFADPFILYADDYEVHFLVEEYTYKDKTGRIARLVADRRTMELKSRHSVLELDSHLSFPAIMRQGDDIYIYPENGKGRGLCLYSYDPSSDTCREVRQLSERPLADATICDIDGRRYMLTTAIPLHNGSQLEVHAVEGDKTTLLQTVNFDRDIARNAGAVFQTGGRYYRPAQESTPDEYGVAVSLQEIGVGEDGKLSFREVAVLRSPLRSLDLGFHTFNVGHGLIVVDAKGYRHPAIARPLRSMARACKRLLKTKA